jgi:UDP-GlcNAc:undecaprenyl-phosphate GlcNAc-1-phosphate transferase
LSDELRAGLAFAATAVLVMVLVPIAMRVAGRLNFYDRPAGYKAHVHPTPYLGGAAVIPAVCVVGVLLGGDVARFATAGGCAMALCAVGTLDDRVGLSPWTRLVAAFAAAVGLWIAGLGWSFGWGAAGDLAITGLWVVALVNALNLMDNMDGAAASVSAASALGIAALAMKAGDAALAALALSLCGGCLAFLRFNLRRPAAIFLGDGGSMSLGLLTAAGTMALPMRTRLGWPALLVGGLVVAVPALDTLLVIWSRTRRSVSILTGGRDHLTHRLRARVSSPHAVALVLASVQLAMCGVAVVAYDLDRVLLAIALPIVAGFALCAVLVLDSHGWRPSALAEDASPGAEGARAASHTAVPMTSTRANVPAPTRE